jgi:hypothetical protein
MTTERRRHPRQAANRSVRAECRVGSHGLGPDIGAVLFDVSEGGLRLALGATVSAGQEVEVVLALPWGRNFRLVADVVWCAVRDQATYWAGLKLRHPLTYAELRELV